jgi:hypothetical protein
LDELWTEFESIKTNKAKLNEFHLRLSKMKFLDPACGCGNFLVITYRELRLLELAILQKQYGSNRVVIELKDVALLDVDIMAGIEYEEFPARIAEVAMWLMDHQMNLKMSMEFGQYYARLPLKKAANIVNANALTIDWNEVVDKDKLNHIIGNPPFIGKKEQKSEQKADMNLIFANIKGTGVLDYVTAWYAKAAQFIQNSKIKVAFVSTNSIAQGEQVGILWTILFSKYKIKIHFAHQSFSWNNEARGNAAVHCVIIGFANFDTNNKKLFHYEDIQGEALDFKANNINPFLIEGKDITVENRKSPICNVPQMNYGSMPIDEGNLILTNEEMEEVLRNEPNISNVIRKYTGGDEFINKKKRWCLWLLNIEPNILRSSRFISDRIEKTKKFRLSSNRLATNKLAEKPMLFGEIRQPNTKYIIIPKVSSENRKYIPIGILDPDTITSGSALIIPNANFFIFGIVTSQMHMVWMANVGGRLESRFQYSASIVYNNFPWPENPTDKQKESIEKAAQKVLDARAEFPNSSLADLYDPLTMPPVLVKAHNELDKAVDAAYSKQAFTSDAKRMEFLFELYEKYTAGLFAVEKEKKKSKVTK